MGGGRGSLLRGLDSSFPVLLRHRHWLWTSSSSARRSNLSTSICCSSSSDCAYSGPVGAHPSPRGRPGPAIPCPLPSPPPPPPPTLEMNLRYVLGRVVRSTWSPSPSLFGRSVRLSIATPTTDLSGPTALMVGMRCCHSPSMLGTTPTAVSSGDRSLPSVHGVLTVGFDGRACTVLGVRSRNGMGREEEEEAFSLLAKRWGNTCKLAGMIERTFCSGVAASAAAGGGGGGERGGEAGGGGGHFGSGGRSFCSSTAAAAGEGGGGGGGGGGGHFGSGGGIVITSDSAAAAMAKRGRKFGGKRQTVVTAAAAKPANQADSNLKTVEEKKAAAEEEDAVMEESKSLSARMKDVLNMKVSKQCKAKAPPFLTCRADDLVIDAVKKMNAGDVGSLVVVDANSVTTDYPMGIVTERDILKKVVAEGREPKTTKVGEVMTGKETLVVSTPDVSAYECMRLMAVHRIRHIPIVLGPEQKLVGIVSIRDMVETILREKEDVQRRLQNYISGIY